MKKLIVLLVLLPSIALSDWWYEIDEELPDLLELDYELVSHSTAQIDHRQFGNMTKYSFVLRKGKVLALCFEITSISGVFNSGCYLSGNSPEVEWMKD